MTLEFAKLTEQVDRMGEYIATKEDEEFYKTDLALKIMEAYADEAWLPEIDRRVQDAIDKDAGYRGARPLDEPIMAAYHPAPLPESATIIATDGSQILPDTHGSSLYYLLNTGTIILSHGSGTPPEIVTQPYLFFEEGYLQTEGRGMVKSSVISARRTVAEMEALTENSWKQRGAARPLISLLDGPLLFVMSADVPDREQLRRVYFSAMVRLMDVQAALVGYTDRPRSRFVISLLHLMDIDEESVSRRSLATNGRIEGVRDIQVFGRFLEPGQRSAIFVQMSPQNKEFRQEGGEELEIAFFYMNVAAHEGDFPVLARVEMPMWAMRNRELVAEVQGLLWQQCQQTVVRYPYVLARADELAVVKREEARQLDMMISVSMTRHGILPGQSAKAGSKDAARGLKTRHQSGQSSSAKTN